MFLELLDAVSEMFCDRLSSVPRWIRDLLDPIPQIGDLPVSDQLVTRTPSSPLGVLLQNVALKNNLALNLRILLV